MNTRPVSIPQMIARAVAFGIAAPLVAAGLALAVVWVSRTAWPLLRGLA